MRYNVFNACGESCDDCDAHGNPEPCPHDCSTHPHSQPAKP